MRYVEDILAYGCSRLLYFFYQFKQPVFVLSAPRAGSSHLTELLRGCPKFWGNPRENDLAWWSLFSYEENNYTDAISGEQFFARYSNAGLKLALVDAVFRAHQGQRSSFIARGLTGRRLRFLDKTVANAFHLEVLRKVFPDASYLFLIRDGRANVSSMIEGWRSGKFFKRPIPKLPSSRIDYWTYPIPCGWENQTARPVEEICAWSWAEHNRAIMAHAEELTQAEQLLQIKYEDLVTDRRATLAKVSSFLNVEIEYDDRDEAASSRPSWSTVSPPRPGKWREYDPEAIERIVPIIAPVMKELGYSLC